MKMTLYLEDEKIHKSIKQAALDLKLSLSEYCLEAVKERLEKDGYLRGRKQQQRMAANMDRLRKEIGPIGVPVHKLIEEGRF